MPVKVASLFGVLSLRDTEFRRGLQNARGEMRSFSGAIGDLGGRVQSLGHNLTLAAAPLAAIGAFGISTAASFEAAMLEISARTGIVGDDLQQISDYALQMGADTIFSGQQAADAFLQLLSSGQTAEQAIATLPAILNLAAASNEDLGHTADIVTDIMAAYGLGVEEAAYVTDVLARAAGASSADVGSLGQGFSNVAGLANVLGLSVEDTAAALAVLSENGIKGAEAGTNLKSMLSSMTNDTESVTGAWNELGISLFDANQEARPLNEVLNDLKAALDPLPTEEQNRLMRDLAGSYGFAGLAALLGSISIDDMKDSMAEQATAAEVAETMMDGFGVKVDSLKGSVEALMITALTPFMNDVLKPLADDLITIVNDVTAWATANPELTQTIISLGAGFILLGPAVSLAGLAIKALGVAIGIVTSPVVILGAAIAALVYVASEFYPGGLAQLFSDAAASARQLAFMGLWLLNSAAQTVSTTIEGFITTVQNIVAGIEDWTGRNGGLILGITGLTIALMSAGVHTKLWAIATAGANLVGSIATAIWGGVTGVVSGLSAALAAAQAGAAGLAAKMLLAAGPILAVGAAIAGVVLQIQEFQRLTTDAAVAAGQALAPQIQSGEVSRQNIEDEYFRQAQEQFGDLGARLIFGSGIINVQAQIDELYNAGMQMGTGAVDGLSAGVADTDGAVTAAMSSTIAGMVDQAGADLGISSPSTVFAGFGRDTVAGLAQGLTAGVPMLAVPLALINFTLTTSWALAAVALAAITPRILAQLGRVEDKLNAVAAAAGAAAAGIASVGGGSGADLGFPSRDVGGPGVAGQPYQIGVPEIFVPHTDGQFIPLGGAQLGGGVHIGQLILNPQINPAAGPVEQQAESFARKFMDYLQTT